MQSSWKSNLADQGAALMVDPDLILNCSHSCYDVLLLNLGDCQAVVVMFRARYLPDFYLQQRLI